MANVRLRRPAGLDRQTTSIANAVDTALSQVVPAPLRSGTELRGEKDAGLTFAAGTPVAIAHKLGRTPSRWWVTRDFGAAAHALRETARDDKFLTLVSSSSCTVYLWVG
jgi:hypothetical protein